MSSDKTIGEIITEARETKKVAVIQIPPIKKNLPFFVIFSILQ